MAEEEKKAIPIREIKKKAISELLQEAINLLQRNPKNRRQVIEKLNKSIQLIGEYL